IRLRHPVLIHLNLVQERTRWLIYIDRAHALMDVLQIEKIAIAELRVEIKVVNVSFLGKRRRILKLDRPDRVVRLRELRRIRPDGQGERDTGGAPAVIKSADVVRIAVPPGIKKLVALIIRGQITIRIV